MDRLHIPLFPLHTVLFPGGPIALRIFEPRYLDMVSRCLKEESGFGVILIREGSEVGTGAMTFEVGTLGHIRYWNKRNDGLLGITVLGEQRFRVSSTEEKSDGLMVAEAELIANEQDAALPARHRGMAELLQGIMEQLDHPYINLQKDYGSASWVGSRLAELLPIGSAQKQYCLQMSDPVERLDILERLLAEKD